MVTKLVDAGRQDVLEDAADETGFEYLCGGRVAGNRSAEITIGLVRSPHHCERVPAHDRRQTLLKAQIARNWRLFVERDCVATGRLGQRAVLERPSLSAFFQSVQHRHGGRGPGPGVNDEASNASGHP